MNFFKKLFNTPFKKCIITNQFYPMSLMVRIVNLFPVADKNTKTIFIPDSLYCIKKPGKYLICNKAIFEKMSKDKSFKKKNNLGDNFITVVLDDLKYSNNVVLKNLIFENKVYFAYFDQKGKMQRIAFEKHFSYNSDKNETAADESEFEVDLNYMVNISTKGNPTNKTQHDTFINRIRELKEKNTIFSSLVMETFLCFTDSSLLKSRENVIENLMLNNSIKDSTKIKTFFFNLEVEKYFKLSEDLVNFYSKLIAEKSLVKNSSVKALKINYLHVLLFEIYSEIITDLFIFSLFMDILKSLLKQKPILLEHIEINSDTVNFKSLSRMSFIFQKIKKYIQQRDNNLHANLEKIIIMIIEEIELNFLGNTQENQISKEKAKEEYEKFLDLKDFIFKNSAVTLNNIYFEAFELLHSNRNSNIFDKLNYLANLLNEFEEPYFYGLFENKTKSNFIGVVKQVGFFVNLINQDLNAQTSASTIESEIFLNINNFKLKNVNDDLIQKGESVEFDEEKNNDKLLNSDYLILNYMRINVLEEGKYITEN